MVFPKIYNNAPQKHESNRYPPDVGTDFFDIVA